MSRLKVRAKSWKKSSGKAFWVVIFGVFLAAWFTTVQGMAAAQEEFSSKGTSQPGPPISGDLRKAAPAATITIDQATNIIHVEGPGSVVTPTDIYNALGKDNWALTQLSSNQWYLSANLLIGQDVELLLQGQKAGGDVDWLMLKSDPSGFVWVQTWNGQISMNATKITSWDLEQETFDTTFYGLKDYEDIRHLDQSALDPNYGRAFVLARLRTADALQARMDISDSEMAYLGFAYPQMQGVAWRSSKDIPLDVGGVTGIVTGSRFHHNYFGIYTFRAVDMIWRGNEFYSNAVYGFDPHDDSLRFLVEGNSFYNNGKHGLIFSVRCNGNVIRGNKSYDNEGHGIVLDIDSDYNLIEGNEVFGNNTGIVLHSSDNNVIRENTIKNNNNGIRIDTRTVSPAQLRQPTKNGDYLSRDNRVIENIIEDNHSFAIYSYAPLAFNAFDNNFTSGNKKNKVYRARAEVDQLAIFAGIGIVGSATILMGALILPYLAFGRRREREEMDPDLMVE